MRVMVAEDQTRNPYCGFLWDMILIRISDPRPLGPWYINEAMNPFPGWIYPGHLIGCDKKSEIVRYFLGRLCDKIGLLCDKLCNFFRANLHCFTRI